MRLHPGPPVPKRPRTARITGCVQMRDELLPQAPTLEQGPASSQAGSGSESTATRDGCSSAFDAMLAESAERATSRIEGP